jgi:hypothetical protein
MGMAPIEFSGQTLQNLNNGAFLKRVLIREALVKFNNGEGTAEVLRSLEFISASTFSRFFQEQVCVDNRHLAVG